MRRVSTVSSMLLLAICVLSGRAEASLADWLDKLGELSGPGPFVERAGGVVDLHCTEMPWYRYPASLHMSRAELDLRSTVDAALERDFRVPNEPSRYNNPFELLKHYPGWKARASGRVVESTAAGLVATESVDALIKMSDRFDKHPVLDVLRERILIRLWSLREALINQPDPDAQQGTLKSWGFDDSESIDKAEREILVRTIDTSLNIGCTGDLRKPRRMVGVYSAWFVTERTSNYRYARVDATTVHPSITAVPVALTYRQTVPGVTAGHPVALRTFEVGAALGAIRFSARPDANPKFDSFWLFPYAEVPRFLVRPLAHAACHSGQCPGGPTKWDLFELELVGKYIPSVSPEQFGAIPGAASGPHFQWHVRAGISIKFTRDRMNTMPLFAE